MKRETKIHRITDATYNYSYIQYGIEEWFENYFENPAKENEYTESSKVVKDLLDFINSECDDQPILVINNIGRKDYYFDENRKAFDPSFLSKTLSPMFEIIIETNEENYCAEWIYKSIYELVKPKIDKQRKILASHQFITQNFIQKHPFSRTLYPTQLEIKIYDMDQWWKLKNKNILFITSGDGPCIELFKTLGVRKLICVDSFISIQNPD